ncbi:MAG: helix-turn-helix domain-containing protein [Oribacterium sp.]|nr:helix-turn-helix domain-containing protein [Oribacterium sp.]
MELFPTLLLIHHLDGSIIFSNAKQDYLSIDKGICLVDPDAAAMCPGYLYVGKSADVLSRIQHSAFDAESDYLVISSGDCPALFQDGYIPKNIRLIACNSKPCALYNDVHDYMHSFHIWLKQLDNVLYHNAGVGELLRLGAEKIDATLLLINAGFKEIAAIYNPHVQDAIAQELHANGYLSFETIEMIHRESPVQSGVDWMQYVSSANNNYNMVHLIRYHDQLVARLIMTLNGPESDAYYGELLKILASYISKYMFTEAGADYSANAALGSLVADLIEARLTDQKELNQRLKLVKLAVKRYYHLLMIHFERTASNANVSIPWNYIISQLEYIFPYSNITTYRGDIILMVKKRKRSSRLQFNQLQLLEILKQYNGYASIGNASEFLTSMPPIYHQIHDALRLARKISPEKRIIYYEDYAMYEIVEMALSGEGAQLASQNPAHLCNNELIALILYDQKYGTDLLNSLRAYLDCEGNTSQAAELLYIHRNTMLNKIHKITDVLGHDLSSTITRDRLKFSYYVLDYANKYLGQNILELHSPTETSQKGRSEFPSGGQEESNSEIRYT